MGHLKTKIYVRQEDNDKYFAQKLPTWRNGFCYIERVVTAIPDPDDIYPEGQYGTIKIGDRQAIVVGDPSMGMELHAWLQ